MSDSEAGSLDQSVQELVGLLESTNGPPPAQPALQTTEPPQSSMTELLSALNSKLDRLQTQYDQSLKNNEALTSLVHAQQQQMNINHERVDALSTELEQHKELVKKKDQEDKATASQVLLHLHKIFPEWITKDSPDKLRGFASSRSPSPKMIIPFDTENSCLAPPTPNAPDAVGSFPNDTEFPTSDKYFVPKGENTSMGSAKNWPNLIPAPPEIPAPPGIPGVPSHPDDDDDGPAAKKPRTEKSLVAEAEWARRFPGPVKFQVG